MAIYSGRAREMAAVMSAGARTCPLVARRAAGWGRHRRAPGAPQTATLARGEHLTAAPSPRPPTYAASCTAATGIPRLITSDALLAAS